jgi:UDP-N-acetylglucosamine transferase subunit ALG13
MIFLTVGTSPLQFDRLVKGMDIAIRGGLIEEEVFAQIGVCRYKPKHMKYSAILDKIEFDACFNKASSIVGHAGMGTISMALEKDKPVLVMARMAEYKEHVNDHQVSTAEMFENLGHVLVAHTVEALPQKIRELKAFKPVKRDATPHLVADRIAGFLRGISH